jgi:hypothetical protein
MANTKLDLKWWDTDQIELELENVQSQLLVETFGNDHEAYYELAEQRSKLFKELKLRNARA